jgi:apolipoprotein N-acyltransferase
MGSARLSIPKWFLFLSMLMAFVLLRFSLGPPLIPILAWLFPVFMLIWVRSNRTSWGLVLGWISAILAVALIALPAANVWGGVLICWIVAGLTGTLLILPFALDRLISHRLPGVLSTLVLPLSWVTVEFFRSFSSYFGTVFALGITQFDFPLITQISSVAGIWAISFLIVWLAPTVCLAMEKRLEWREIARPVSLFLGTLIAVMCFGGIRLGFDQPNSPTVRVAGLTASSRDGTLESGVSFLSTYIPQAAAAGARIVVTHEGGIRISAEDEAALIAAAQELTRQNKVYISLGLQTVHKDRDLPFDNKAAFISPDGKLLSVYIKQRLTPPEATNHIRGQGPVPVIETPYGKIATVICNDAVFSHFVRHHLSGKGVDILLVPAWDPLYAVKIWSYFMSFRAIENGVSMFRLAREGLTLAVDYQGRPLVYSNYYLTDQRVIFVDLPTKGRRTAYSLLGDWFAWLSVAGFVVLLGIALTKHRPQEK